jgi:aryl-alcohol dehydrogenase-like predicted oxidoreductase
VKRRRLGRTGLEVSEIGFGCGGTAGLMIRGSRGERRMAVERALELGIDYFDTAPIYGETASEAHLGETLRELEARPVVATKVALTARDFSDPALAVVRSVEGSLERLGLQQIALVQLHNRVGERRASRADFGSGALLTAEDVLGPGGVVEGLRTLRSRGLVRFFGCCAYGGDVAAVNRLIDSGAFDTVLVNYSLLNMTAWESPGAGVRDYGGAGARAASVGMGTIALRVLEGGLLSGAAQKHPMAAPVLGPDYDAMATRAPAALALLGAHGLSPAQGAIRFVLSNEQLSTVLIGFSDSAQIEEAVRCSVQGPLPAELIYKLQ